MDPQKDTEGDIVPPTARHGSGRIVRGGGGDSGVSGCDAERPVRRSGARPERPAGRSPLSDWLFTLVGSPEPKLDPDIAFVIAIGADAVVSTLAALHDAAAHSLAAVLAITDPNVELWAEPDTRTPPFEHTTSYDYTGPATYTRTEHHTPAHPIRDTDAIWHA